MHLVLFCFGFPGCLAWYPAYLNNIPAVAILLLPDVLEYVEASMFVL